MSSPSAPMTLRSLRSERYQLVSSLGEGGMATVWLARDTELDVDRAIKLIHPDPSKRRALRRRLKAEARAMARLSHPNILRILDVGAEGDYDYVVMDLAPGGSLQDALDAEGALPTALAVAYTVQVLSALAAAHAAGIVHRDVKPQNILLDATGRALLADFGIALLADDDLDRKTKAGVAMGSLAYMPPEQRVDARSVGPAADIYATGATLYALLTQSNPVDLFSAGEASPRWDGIHPQLAAIIRTSTSVQVADRFQSAGDMARELMEAAKRISPSELPEPGRPGNLFPTPSNVFATQGNTSSSSTFDNSTPDFAPERGQVTPPTITPATNSGGAPSHKAPSTSDPGYTPTAHTDVDVRTATAMALKLIDDVPVPHTAGPTLVEAELGALDDDDDGVGLVILPPTPPPGGSITPAPLALDARPSTHPPAKNELQLRATIAAAILVLAAVIGLFALSLRESDAPTESGSLTAAEGASEVVERSATSGPRSDGTNTDASASPEASGSGASQEPPAPGDAGGETSGTNTPGGTAEGTPSKPSEPPSGTAAPKTAATTTSTGSVAAHPPKDLTLPAGASALPAPLGGWKGASGRFIMTLHLTGTHDAVRGEYTSRFGSNVNRSKVTGAYNPATRKLTLTDGHSGADAGTYDLTLSNDNARLVGTFTRNIGGVASIALKRTP